MYKGEKISWIYHEENHLNRLPQIPALTIFCKKIFWSMRSKACRNLKPVEMASTWPRTFIFCMTFSVNVIKLVMVDLFLRKPCCKSFNIGLKTYNCIVYRAKDSLLAVYLFKIYLYAVLLVHFNNVLFSYSFFTSTMISDVTRVHASQKGDSL